MTFDVVRDAIDGFHDTVSTALEEATKFYGQYPRDGLGRRVAGAENDLKTAHGAIKAYDQLCERLAELEAEVAALRADARRWRYLYSNCCATWEPAGNMEVIWDITIQTAEPPQVRSDQLKAAIDAALSSSGPAGGEKP